MMTTTALLTAGNGHGGLRAKARQAKALVDSLRYLKQRGERRMLPPARVKLRGVERAVRIGLG